MPWAQARSCETRPKQSSTPPPWHRQAKTAAVLYGTNTLLIIDSALFIAIELDSPGVCLDCVLTSEFRH